MLVRSGLGIARLTIIATLALLSLVLALPVAAQSSADIAVLQLRTSFNVTEPPSSSFHAHQSMLLFEPGAEAPLHSHGGPGYITILHGELTLYEDGVENVYQAGDSLVETSDKLYKGGNYTDENTVLMVTYLVPHGEDMTTFVDDPEAPDPPAITPQPLAEAMHEFSDSPSSFDLVHTTTSYGPGANSELFTASGETLLTLVTGELRVTVDEESRTVSAGSAVVIEADQEYSFHNGGEADAFIMSTELSPDIHSVVPAAGSTVDRTFAMWLVVMTASALLVVGGVLRLTEVRMR